ncbi:hypothetical protein GCM10027578_22650 [Spirosoma luteolum]
MTTFWTETKAYPRPKRRKARSFAGRHQPLTDRRPMKQRHFGRVFRMLILGMLVVGLMGLAVRTLWNALLPDIAGLSTITFWQALGLLLLGRLLTGFRLGPRGWGAARRGMPDDAGGPNRWKRRMAERWQQMTPEGREQLKERFRRHCGDRDTD